MATSGTLHGTTFDAATILEHMLRLCRISPAAATPEVLKLAEEALYLFLTTLQTKGVHLWCLDKALYGLEANVTAYPLSTGIHDAKEVYLLTPSLVYGTDSAATDEVIVQYGTDQTPRLLGVLAGVSGSYALAVESSDDGAVWTTLQTSTMTLVDGTYSWVFIDKPVSAAYFRVRDTAAAGTLTGTLATAEQWSSRELTRESRDRHANSYRPWATSPSTFWIDRGASVTTLWLDRAPQNASDALWVWARRNVQDVGDLYHELDLPRHWLAATISNAAMRLAMELPEERMPLQRLQAIIAMAGQDLQAVEDEEYDESDVELDFELGAYTR